MADPKAITKQNFISKDGLQEFLTKLKDAYKNNALATFSEFEVGKAQQAVKDGNGDVIMTTYLKAAALDDYVKATEIASGASNGTIAVKGTDVEVKGLAAAAYQSVANVCTVESAGSVLDARQGKALSDRIEALEGMGRYLSTWNCETGLPDTNPGKELFDENNRYNYQKGDYFIISNVVETKTSNWMPAGTYCTIDDKTKEVPVYTYDKAALTEGSAMPQVGGMYVFDSAAWSYVAGGTKTTTFRQIVGDCMDNTSLASKFNDIDINKVSITRTINSKALGTDITLNGADLTLTGYVKGSDASAVVATDTINAAFGKVENQIDAEATARDAAIAAAINALDATVSQTAGTDGLALSITETDGKITALTGSIASGTYLTNFTIDGESVKSGSTAGFKFSDYIGSVSNTDIDTLFPSA